MSWAVLLLVSRGDPVAGCLWPSPSIMASMGQAC
jgi:hypothetical protein